MQTSKLPFITDRTDLRGKRIIVRASLNVPLENGTVRNYFRLMRAMPTLMHLTHAGAKVIVIGHIGRDPNLSLQPVHEVLKDHLDIAWSDAVVGDAVTKQVEALAEGQALLLQNLRAHEGETKNDPDFAAALAELGDLYVNDSFSVSHREHASIVGLPQHLPSCFGLTFRQEYTQLIKSMDPISPAIFILGGAKFETKQPLIEKYMKKYDTVFVGGALANDFFKAQGYEVGTSLVSKTPVPDELTQSKKVMLPVDVTVQGEQSIRVTTPDAVEADENILDAGPATVAQLAEYIANASMVLWNGPLGDYERGFGEQTRAVAKLIAESDAYSVVGGGDTIAAIEALALNDQFGFLSTAGGAMLAFLEHGSLVGIDAVTEART